MALYATRNRDDFVPYGNQDIWPYKISVLYTGPVELLALQLHNREDIGRRARICTQAVLPAHILCVLRAQKGLVTDKQLFVWDSPGTFSARTAWRAQPA